MSDFKDRVRLELAELREKIAKLTAFVTGTPTFEGLDADEQHLLRTQLAIMHGYELVLSERARRLGIEAA